MNADNTHDMLDGYEPWRLVMWPVVHTKDPVGEEVSVMLPYIAAGSKEAVRITGIFMASKIAHELYHQRAKDQNDLQISNLRSLVYSPPLVRFWCEECDSKWDAWVDDQGILEDRWSCVCTNEKCSHHGVAATLLPESI